MGKSGGGVNPGRVQKKKGRGEKKGIAQDYRNKVGEKNLSFLEEEGLVGKKKKKL